MELEKIRELIRLVEESRIQELELSNRGETIRISKGQAGVTVVPTAQPTSPLAPPVAAAAAPAAAPAPAPEAAAPAPASTAVARGSETLREIASPMVGTFYRAPSPDAEPYVRAGDRVEKGDVVCIVEAMKLMNEIEAEISGVVREVLVENAQPVEFGQPLFLIDTAA
jgi:acetyl-CoA carboxylase biotin carboxyl carrier protein